MFRSGSTGVFGAIMEHGATNTSEELTKGVPIVVRTVSTSDRTEAVDAPVRMGPGALRRLLSCVQENPIIPLAATTAMSNVMIPSLGD